MILVPFTWRLRTLLFTAGAYDSGATPAGPAARLLYYPLAAWETWAPTGVDLVLLGLLAGSAVAAWRVRDVAERLAPIAILAALEWLTLSVASRHNFQPRFALNLAPLLALSAAAWVPAVPATWARLLLAAAATAALLAAAIPGWQKDALAAVLSEGFDPAETASACRQAAEAMPPGAVVINDAPLSHRQGCALWATVLARQEGRVVEFAVRPRSSHPALFLLSDCSGDVPVPHGFIPGAELRLGALCAQGFSRVARGASP